MAEAKSKESSGKILSLDDILYRLGMGTIVLGAISYVVYELIPNKWNIFGLPCLFHVITGYYCPGCGGRRALDSLFHGNILESIFFHPAVVYSIAVFAWYMISQTLERRKIGKIKAMSYKNRYVYIGLGITFINLILKNLVLIIWNIRLI